ncbi:MAG: ribosome maturation factor RimP [Pseudomonadota bacterium]|jgi:ribosome maturation factor RimP
MKQSSKTQSLHDLIAPAVAACNVDLWGIEFLQQGRKSLLRIYIDKTSSSEPQVADVVVDDDQEILPIGVGVQDCVAVTHQVSGVLDVHDPITGEYALEVSSPGWDRPFFSLSQMTDYIGQTVALRLISPVLMRRKLNGELVSVTDHGISVSCEGQTVEIDADNIDKAHLVYQD